MVECYELFIDNARNEQHKPAVILQVWFSESPCCTCDRSRVVIIMQALALALHAVCAARKQDHGQHRPKMLVQGRPKSGNSRAISLKLHIHMRQIACLPSV